MQNYRLADRQRFQREVSGEGTPEVHCERPSLEPQSSGGL